MALSKKMHKCAVCTKPLGNLKRGVKTCDAECEEIFQRGLKLKVDWKLQKQAIKETLKKKSDWEKELQVLINKLVRLIDQGHPCISSQRMEGKREAGHYYSCGSNPTVRFHLMNIYAQTSQDNNNKSGNPIGYREGLISTFGIEHMEYVESLKAHPPIKLTVDDLKDKIRIARRLIKEFELFDVTTYGRIALRQNFNQELNIYQY